ncbi:MAG: flagellar hook protein FlgE [Burkholderiales bacterium]|jgi:flagellar hook protein FlgE|nr:flagellar hook protein FlgE [Rhodocyclaceae bacterium]MCA3021779.1 flagellar hook protein FlgE [Rhodocyclaceae bacterium]MCA3044185.1 flagellar hook protein FlgE [Rhodocyclaceae bacterium]MCA3053905.1 flagellar hook protein FlgE [Rhodocyclaceae bacterium]MCA3057175.1 flagellar hook protein FlgE [Rhodocyclaceae bacterium]
MSFQQGLSGLNAAARNLDVIGNNVANANTIGFKQARAEFADLYANTLASAERSTIGLGVTTTNVSQQFSQGNISSTSSPLDIAISGGGLFRVSNNGSIAYTRNGQFQIDKSGYVVTGNGARLSGFPVDATGKPTTGAPADLKISASDIAPKPTSEISFVMNLDSRKTVPTGTFSPTDASTYTSATSLNVYDSQGNAHTVSTYLVKTATANTWDVYATLDGANVGAGKIGSLVFKADGSLNVTASAVPFNVALTTTNGASFPTSIPVNFAGTTQFGSAFGVNAANQDGYAAGKLIGLTVDNGGVISGRYSNGQAQVQGQIALVSFANMQGLSPTGGNQWVESSTSGAPLVGTPGSTNLGMLQSGAVEESNVDLTAELVNMITAQRNYQANAQTIKTQDQVLQTLVNLR